jgi:hypothetical protein
MYQGYGYVTLINHLEWRTLYQNSSSYNPHKNRNQVIKKMVETLQSIKVDNGHNIVTCVCIIAGLLKPSTRFLTAYHAVSSVQNVLEDLNVIRR